MLVRVAGTITHLARTTQSSATSAVEAVRGEVHAGAIAIGEPCDARERALTPAVANLTRRAEIAAATAVIAVPREVDAHATAVVDVSQRRVLPGNGSRLRATL